MSESEITEAALPSAEILTANGADAAPPPVSTPLPPPGSWRDAIRYSFLCGSIGFLFGLRMFAAATLPHILTADGLNFQEIMEGLPVPHLLDWNVTDIGLLQDYSSLNPLFLVLGLLLLSGLLLTSTLRIASPAGRLFHPVSAATTGEEAATIAPETTTALDGKLLLRLTLLAATLALPGLAIWKTISLLTQRFPHAAVALTSLGCALAGIGAMHTLHPQGLIGRLLPLTPSNSNLPAWRSQLSLPVLTLRGIVLGLSVCLLQLTRMPVPSQNMLLSLHALGTFHNGIWDTLADHFLLSFSLVWMSTGLLLWLALQERPRSLFWLVCLLVALPLGYWLGLPYTPRALTSRYDLSDSLMKNVWPYDPKFPGSGVPNGIDAGHTLSSLVEPETFSNQRIPPHRFLLFTPGGVYNGLQQGYTEDKLQADPAKIPLVKAFLRKRGYETALSWTAFKFVFNVGNVRFDNTLALRACLDDLEHSPHNAVVTPTVRAMLFTVSASPQNVALLDEWADESKFAHPDRGSRKLMGDLYLRFGETKKALVWYAQAEMPRSFMAKVRTEKPLFHTGTIHGTLLWNGKPMAGVQVGALPKRQNGLPKDLEGSVFAAETELFPFRSYSPEFGPVEPRPYNFRWISAGTVTNSKGEFALENLTEGTYHLLCTLPPSVVMEPFREPRLGVKNAPGDLILNYRTPAADLGKIELDFKP